MSKKNRQTKTEAIVETPTTAVSSNDNTTIQVDVMAVPERGRGRTVQNPYTLKLINLKQSERVNNQLTGESFVIPVKSLPNLNAYSARRKQWSLVTRREGDKTQGLLRIWKESYHAPISRPRKAKVMPETPIVPETTISES